MGNNIGISGLKFNEIEINNGENQKKRKKSKKKKKPSGKKHPNNSSKTKKTSAKKNKTSAKSFTPGEIEAKEVVSMLKRQFSNDVKKKLELFINPRASKEQEDPDMFEAIEHVKEFINNKDKKVLLILGDAGSGKSLLGNFLTLQMLQKGNFTPQEGQIINRIPMFIQLNEIKNPTKKLLKNYLEDHLELTPKESRYTRNNFPILLFLDGFDEMKLEHRKNLFRSNNFGAMSNVKVIITCRTSALLFVSGGRNYKELFAPTNNGYDFMSLDQIFIRPFSKNDIENYVSKFIKKNPKGTWEKEKILSVFKEEHLEGILSNPFLMFIALKSLSRLFDDKKKRKGNRILKYHLYESFVSAWFDREKVKRIDNKKVISQKRLLNFSHKLAAEMFRMETHVFKYLKNDPEDSEDDSEDDSEENESDSHWKEFFEKNIKKSEGIDILNCIPLGRIGEGKYKFLHKSIWEYLLANLLMKDLEKKSRKIDKTIVHLNYKLLNNELSIVRFIADVVRTNKSLQKTLFDIVLLSRNRDDVSIASANAATILNFARVPFSAKDLNGIKIPGANLSKCICFNTNLSGSNLSNCVFQNGIIEFSNFEDCNMKGIQFGESPSFCGVFELEDSPCGRYIASVEKENKLKIRNKESMDTVKILECVENGKMITWCEGRDFLLAVGSSSSKKIYVFNGGNEGKEFTTTIIEEKFGKYTRAISWSSNNCILAVSIDNVICLYDGNDKYKCIKVIKEHKGNVTGLGFHPNSNFEMLVSADSNGSIFVWKINKNYSKINTLESIQPSKKWKLKEISKKEKMIICFHPNKESKLVAIGGMNCIQVWDGSQGFKRVFIHKSKVNCCQWNPNPYLSVLAVGDSENKVFIYDGNRDFKFKILKGHSGSVNCISWHPSNSSLLLATASSDLTVRVWDGTKEYSSVKLEGHTKEVDKVCWSSVISKKKLLSFGGGMENTLRTWDLSSQNESPNYELHKGSFYDFRMSWCPNEKDSVFIVNHYKDKEMFLIQTEEGFMVTKIDTPGEISKYYWHPNTSSSIASFCGNNELFKFKLNNSNSSIAFTELTNRKKSPKKFKSLSWFPDSNSHICAALPYENNDVYIIDMKKNVVLMKLNGHKSEVNAIGWHPDGAKCLLGSVDNAGVIIIWEINLKQKKYKNTVLKGHKHKEVFVIEWNSSVNELMFASVSRQPDDKSIYDILIWKFNENKWEFKLVDEKLFQNFHNEGVGKVSWHSSKTSFLLAINRNVMESFVYVVDVKNNYKIIQVFTGKIGGDSEWLPLSSRAIIAAGKVQKEIRFGLGHTNVQLEFWEFSLTKEKDEGKLIFSLTVNVVCSISDIKFLPVESQSNVLKVCLILHNLCLRFYTLKLGKKPEDVTMVLQHSTKPLLLSEDLNINKCIITKKNSLLLQQKGAFFNEITVCEETKAFDNVDKSTSVDDNTSNEVRKKSNYHKFAFIVGNKNYSSLSSLKNPINDANKVSKELTQLGFFITETYVDLDSDDLHEEFEFFCHEILEKTDEHDRDKILVVIFYAGHSVFFDTNEYLLPVDFESKYFKVEYTEKDKDFSVLLERQRRRKLKVANCCLSRKKVLDVLSTIGGKHLLFLDACRDHQEVLIVKVEKKEEKIEINDEINVKNEKTNESISTNKALTRSMNGNKRETKRKGATCDFIVSFSTQRGEKSLDGDGNNSLYTIALCDLLKSTGKLLDLLAKVKIEVDKKSDNNQIPEFESSFNDTQFMWPPDRVKKL